jgi:hypothetical protein
MPCLNLSYLLQLQSCTCRVNGTLSPPHTSALVARTCYSWPVGSTTFPRVRATFTAFSSFVTCKPNIKHVWYFSSFVTKKFSCATSKRQARLNRKMCACVQLAELKTRHELVILIRHVVHMIHMTTIQWHIITILENTCMQKPSPCWQNHCIFRTWSI